MAEVNCPFIVPMRPEMRRIEIGFPRLETIPDSNLERVNEKAASCC